MARPASPWEAGLFSGGLRRFAFCARSSRRLRPLKSSFEPAQVIVRTRSFDGLSRLKWRVERGRWAI